MLVCLVAQAFLPERETDSGTIPNSIPECPAGGFGATREVILGGALPIRT
jgi:hypothetical protein